MPRTNLAARVGGWSARHRWTALIAWFVLVVAAVVAGTMSGTVKLTETQLADGQAAHAARVIDAAGFANRAGETVLVRDPGQSLSDPAFVGAIRQVTARLDTLPQVTNVRSPLDRGALGQVSKDQHSVIVQFDVRGSSDTAADRIQPVMDAVASIQRQHPGMVIAEFGQASSAHVLNAKINGDLAHARNVSLPLTLAILLFAFGAIIAAGVPVLLAFSAVLATFGLNELVSHVMPTVDVSAEIILLIGMAVGVDYSLFYLRRERDERSATKPADRARIAAVKADLKAARRAGDAGAVAAMKAELRAAKAASAENRGRSLQIAASTSGQAVLISGVTVMIAVGGMLLAGDATFVALGIAAMLVVAVAVVGSLTGLPAILSILGDRVDRGRIPLLGRRGSGGMSEDSRFWGAIIDRVLRRPAVSAALATGALLVAAIPALSINTQTPDFRYLPQSLPIVKTYEQIQASFPGGSSPAVIAFKAPDVTSPQARAAIRDFTSRALASGEVGNPIEVTTSADHTVAKITAPLVGNGQDAASNHALATLRGQVIPATLGRVGGSDVSVTGETAGGHDFQSLMRVRTPIVFAFVLGLAFIVLLLTFRSIVIPIKAIVLNLLSVGAAYGVLVAVFQYGWGSSLLGFHSTHTIANWLPLFLFVVLFGLSMDYHVFILSRVKELVDDGVPTQEAVSRGIKGTAGVVTSAAVVMVGVFGIFGTLSVLDIKQFGFGAAVAILIDATVIRAVLLPATMSLLGEWNWYMPRSLGWIPSLRHGSAPVPAEA